MVALDAFESGNHILHLHPCHKATNALQIAIAPTIKLYVGDDTIFNFHIDVRRAGTLSLIGYFHKLTE